MIAQILTYGLLGLSTGLGAQALMPTEKVGNAWIAALLGTDAALLGAYLTRSYLANPGEGTTLFMVVLASFLAFAAYRTAFRRLLDSCDGEQVCSS